MKAMLKKKANEFTKSRDGGDATFIARVGKSHANCLENLPLFAAVVLVNKAFGGALPRRAAELLPRRSHRAVPRPLERRERNSSERAVRLLCDPGRAARADGQDNVRGFVKAQRTEAGRSQQPVLRSRPAGQTYIYMSNSRLITREWRGGWARAGRRRGEYKNQSG